MTAPNQMFAGVQFVPGIGYVQGAGMGLTPSRGLGDESAVMMISGLGAAAPANPWPTQAQWQAERTRYVGWMQAANTPGLTVKAWAGPVPPEQWPGAGSATSKPGVFAGLQQPITLFNVELPLWAWLAIAALLGGAGGAGLMHLKMKR